MTEHTHEVRVKPHWRSSSQNDDEDAQAGEAGAEVFEVGDTITPTEAELDAFPEQFRELRHVQSEDDEEDEEGN